MISEKKDLPKDNYELVVLHDQQRFLKRDAAEMAKNTHLTIDHGQILVPHYNIDYTVDIKTAEIAYADKKDAPISVNRRMMILHHLLEAKEGATLAHDFVSMHSLKDANIHTQAFNNRAVFPLAKFFAGNPHGFMAAGEALGAVPTQGGDVAFILHAFPTIPMKYIFWDGDDEVPASANILFDRSITDFTHPEDVIGLGEYGSYYLMDIAEGKPLF